MIKLYLARAMTGRDKKVVVEEANADYEFFTKAGFKVFDPVREEGVQAEGGTINSTKAQMDEFWKRDKAMIRQAHIILDMTPHLKSEGVAHEIGYARYFLWKKVIRVYIGQPLPPSSSVAFYEDDYLADCLIDATREIYQTHGTYWKRLKWRFNLLNKCLLKAIWYQLKEWK